MNQLMIYDGPSDCDKTTYLEEHLRKFKNPLYLTGERFVSMLLKFVSSADCIAIDNIGAYLKGKEYKQEEAALRILAMLYANKTVLLSGYGLRESLSVFCNIIEKRADYMTEWIYL